ncbi:DUF3231 family protein [Tenuibacillus multivorans]|uniref:DUF3231 family protein n=1 Tax=Tenuibacillus multivorans TaxID=237069 RepID=A0A1H0ET83_9BACI|nr:DUF3231 family protein [Tenuibacillus multivorans]GEL76960.1 hypothetical protein TMU01_11950 [Tenuibacillus multivorans]SDN85667.1 Protein of unknown function [Tenuibacillus multivorans]
METDKRNVKLTSAEISSLWSTYMNDSGVVCHLQYQLNKVEDEDIKPVLQNALSMSQSRMQMIEEIFYKDNYPIPHGFKVDEDVDITAPRLFSDIYFLNTANQLGKIGLNNFSVALAASVRDDVYHFFSQSLRDADLITKESNEVLLSKGIFVRSPYLPHPETYDFVKDGHFLAGYFGDKRPLIGSEISNFYGNFQRNALGAATLMGYSQVAKDEEVAQFFVKGKDIAKKHCEIFGSYLRKNDLPSPMAWGSEVTDVTTYVFSDRKMMFYTLSLIALSIAYYGSSLSMSPRRDIGVTYSRLIAELMKYSDEGTRVMIKNGWMEEPPRALDRGELARKKT